MLIVGESWSRWGGLNAPSADYNSAALPLSYTGSLIAYTIPDTLASTNCLWGLLICARTKGF